MKKMFTKLLAGIMTIGCVCSMAACGPRLKIDDVEDNLEDEDYIVTITKGDDLDKDEAYMEKILYARSEDDEDDYFYMIEFKDAKTAKLYYRQEKVWYKTCIMEDEAELKYYQQLLDEYGHDMKSEEEDDLEDEIDELEDCIEEDKEALECLGRSGVYVWFASNEDVLEDAQGK